MTILPLTGATATPGEGPRLEFDIFTTTSDDRWIELVASPSIPVRKGSKLRYAIAVDDEAPVVVDLAADPSDAAWERSVIAAAHIGRSRHRLATGRHIVRLWAVDRGVVAQRLLIGAKPTDPLALGPPASQRR